MSKAFLALALAAAAQLAQAQAVQPQVQPGYGTRNLPEAHDDRIGRRDRAFLHEAVNLNHFEIMAARLAAVRARAPLVRSYASMLVNHHTAANNQLQQLANAARVTVPTLPARQLRRDVEQIAEMEGSAFDRVFLKRVGIAAHEDAIRMHERARGEVRNRALQAYIARTLPRLREHLAEARRLQGD